MDRSIADPSQFMRTNLLGTYTLLEVSLDYWRNLAERDATDFRFIHISTDEVFGSLGEHGFFNEQTAYDPSSPYSASKAGSDHLVRAWFRTYGLPTAIVNCSNNYGPYQHPEKLIPLTIVNALQGRALPVYGKGENVRDWLYVADHAEALMLVAKAGTPGESYNIGGRSERRNIEVVKTICTILDDIKPRQRGSHLDLISFVTDRLGHDFRYAVDCSKIERELGWLPTTKFEAGLRQTIEWFVANPTWWDQLSNSA